MLRNLFKNSNKMVSLGRWQTADQRADIRAVLANYDSCGDNLCGNPSLLKKAVDEIEIKIKEEEEKINVMNKDKKKGFNY